MKLFFSLLFFSAHIFASDFKLLCPNNTAYEISQNIAKEFHQINMPEINNRFSCTYINGITSKKDEDPRNNEDDLLIFRGRHEHCSMGRILIINPFKAKVTILNSKKMTVVNLSCSLKD